MKNFLEQMMRIWKEFGASQKVVVLASLGMIVAVMSGILIWSSQPKMQLLYGKMGSDDMANVVSHLEGQGVPYKVAGGGGSVLVPADKVYSLRMELASKGVPHGEGVGFEIFDESNFGISDFVQKTNLTRAVQGELSRTIGQLRGVKSARVLVSVPENRLLAEASDTRATASVFVDTGSATLGESAVNSIRHLVANSVEGLQVDNVAVVDNSGNVLSDALRGDGTIGAASSRMRMKQGIEEYFTNKVESMLTKVLGKGNVVARVSVKIDTETSTIIEERYDPAGQVVRSQTTTEDTNTTDSVQPKAVAGVATGGEGDFGGVPQNTNSSKNNTKKKTVAYEISKSKREVVKTPGTIQEVSAAVFLALVEREEGGQMVKKPRTPEELNTIRQMVINTLGNGTEDVTDATQRITIQEVPFAQEPVVQTAGFLDLPEWAYKWIDVVKGFLGLLITLIMFRIFFKMLKANAPGAGKVELLDGEGGGGESAKNVTPQPTADLINQLIKEKPENIGMALKNWAATGDGK